MSVSFWLVMPVGSLEPMSAFRKFVAILKFGVTDRLGSKPANQDQIQLGLFLKPSDQV